jgi:hypothetical protein
MMLRDHRFGSAEAKANRSYSGWLARIRQTAANRDLVESKDQQTLIKTFGKLCGNCRTFVLISCRKNTH